MSALTCGCDREAGWICERHQAEPLPMRAVCMFCRAVLVDVPEDARGVSHGLCQYHQDHYDEACAELASETEFIPE